MTRRGQPAAFEVLCARYQSRLLSFCRHLLASREDAEDVLQEVFAAAYNAVLADDRTINVRPWLYRIARNRSLNHLRRASAIGVDSMDIHFADHGLSTGDRVIRRESFRELIADVHELPETQRTALLLREIDALSYEQIADAMETTVPSVKSLLVRARISLAEAAEARKLNCEEVRLELGEAAEGLSKLSTPARRHVRGCERCGLFKKQLKHNNRALAAIFPVGPLVLFHKLLLAKLGSASGAHVAGGAGASVSAGAGATVGAGAATGAGAAATGAGLTGGLLTAGAGALATKTVAGLAAAAIVTAGAVAVERPSPRHPHRAVAAAAPIPIAREAEPVIVRQISQPLSSDQHALAARGAGHRAHPVLKPAKHPLATAAAPAVPPVAVTAAPVTPAASATKPVPAKQPPAPTTEVTSETTQLPPSATVQPPPPPAKPEPATTTETTPSPPPANLPTAEPVPPPPSSSPPPSAGKGKPETGGTPAAPEAEPGAAQAEAPPAGG